MDLLNGNLKKIYFKYLVAAFGSALITTIYSFVDMAMVGQYHGPDGASALAVIAPIWNIIYALGLLIGIGGSIMYSYIKAKTNDTRLANKYFTASIFYGIIISAIAWILILVFEDNLLYFFGANDTLLPLCKEYLAYIKIGLPVFAFTQIISAYLRNDNDPILAGIAVIGAGIFNIVGDYLLVFTCDLGILGAGIATMIGATISLIIMFIHFFKKKNTLKLVFEKDVFKLYWPIVKNGFPSFVVDFAMGFLTIIFNNQIMHYLSTDALSVYSILINISTFVQCSGYGVGQASQPILSANYGVNKMDRVKKINKYAIITSIFFGALYFILVCAIPNDLVNFFMKPTESVLNIASTILRTYSISFLLLVLNVYSTYFFQSILKSYVSLIISIARGIVLSGAFALLLPLITPNMIWFTMPITELLVFMFVIFEMIYNCKKVLKNTDISKITNNTTKEEAK